MADEKLANLFQAPDGIFESNWCSSLERNLCIDSDRNSWVDLKESFAGFECLRSCLYVGRNLEG